MKKRKSREYYSTFRLFILTICFLLLGINIINADVATSSTDTGVSNLAIVTPNSLRSIPEFEKETVKWEMDDQKYKSLRKNKEHNVIIRINPERIRNVFINGRPAVNVLGSNIAQMNRLTGKVYTYAIGALTPGQYYLSYEIETQDGFANVVQSMTVQTKQTEFKLGGEASSMYTSSGMPPLSEYFGVMDPIMGADKGYKAMKFASGIAEIIFSSKDTIHSLISYADYFKAAHVLYKESQIKRRKMDQIWEQMQNLQKGYSDTNMTKKNIEQILGI